MADISKLKPNGATGTEYNIIDDDYRKTDHTFTMNTYSSYSHTFENTQISQTMPVRNVFTAIQSLFNSVKTAINDHGSLFGDIATALTNKVSKDEATYKSLSYSSATHEIDDSEELTTQFDGAGEMGSVWFANMNLGVVTDAVNDHAEWIAKETAGAKTVTSNPLTITDASPMKAEKIEIGFEPKQDKHGYNSVWVGGAGKNKIILTSAKIKQRNTSGTWTNNSYAWNGVTYALTVDSQDNVTRIALSGTRSGDSYLYLMNQDDIYLYSNSIAGNQMILNGCPANGGSDKYYLSTWISGSGTKSDYGSGITAAYPASTTQCNITLGVANGYSISGTLDFYPMLRLATVTDATFAPYSNISPITGYTSLSADGCGKNFLNINGAQDTTYATGTISGSQITVTGKYYLKIAQSIPAGTYTFSFTLVSQTLMNGVRFVYDDGTQTGIIYGQAYVDTNGKKIVAMLLYSGTNTSGTSVYKDMQLETASLPTTYEPFKGDNVTVQFGQTLYGGKLTILQDGSAEVECVLGIKTITELNAGSHITRETASGRVRYVANISDMEKKTVRTMANLYSDRYETISDGRTYANCPDYCIFNRPEGGAFINEQRYSSVSDFVAANGDSVIVYPLANPFTLHLPPVETLTLLQGINNVWTDGNTLSLTYQPDNAIGEAKGKAVEVMDYAQEIARDNYSRNLWKYGDVTFTGYNIDISIDFELTGTFTISLVATSTDTDASTCAMIIYYKSGSTSATYQWSRGSREWKTINIGDNVVDKIRFYSSDNYNHGAGDTANFKEIYLELGSTQIEYEPYIPTNKELANTRPALKTKSISATTGSDGNIALGTNIVPVYADMTTGYICLFYGSPSTGIGGHVINRNSTNSVVASTSVTGTLYYYDV